MAKNLNYFKENANEIMEIGVSKFFEEIGEDGKNEMIEFVAEETGFDAETLKGIKGATIPEVLIVDYFRFLAMSALSNKSFYEAQMYSNLLVDLNEMWENE